MNTPEKTQQESEDPSAIATYKETLIVGAGFAGLGMGIQLKLSGRTDFVILERADRVGGTWRDNTYPGAACDVPSFVYSFSFEPWPEWSRMYSPHNDIYDYLSFCVEKYEIAPFLHLNTAVARCEFDENANQWRVFTQAGMEFRCKFLITGTGPLNKPKIPEFIGLDSFKGAKFHSAEWDHDFDYAGKRIAVVGTGASAIQIVPAIAGSVSNLSLFQRSPAWVVPRSDRAISGFEKKVYRTFPFIQQFLRTFLYWVYEATGIPFFRIPKIFNIVQKQMSKRIRKIVPDPHKAAKLIPHYKMGCKRILVSDDYYPAVARENVSLITEPIKRITENGILTEDGTLHAVDAIAFATGFEASEDMAPFPIKGRKGFDLNALWAKGGEAYLGTTVHGFPNLFVLVGPNVGLGHNSLIHLIESQVHYILDGIKRIERAGKPTVEVKQTVQTAFNKKLQARMDTTVWMQGGCKSWYQTSDGKITTLYPGFTFQFRRETRRFKMEEYQ